MMLIWSLILAAQAAAPLAVSMPAFLAGCWEHGQPWARWTEECWTFPRGGMMLGSGRDGTGDHINHWEWMRIERGADGVPLFYASLKGATPVAFRMIKGSANEAEFVNPSHDFPQRVRYVRTATGIDAEISLADGSKPVRWSYRASGSPTGK